MRRNIAPFLPIIRQFTSLRSQTERDRLRVPEQVKTKRTKGSRGTCCDLIPFTNSFYTTELVTWNVPSWDSWTLLHRIIGLVCERGRFKSVILKRGSKITEILDLFRFRKYFTIVYYGSGSWDLCKCISQGTER